MYSLTSDGRGTIQMSGIIDSSHADAVREFFKDIDHSCTIDCEGLEFISSAGLGILMATYKRLSTRGETIRLINVRENVKKIFHLARFDRLFSIE